MKSKTNHQTFSCSETLSRFRVIYDVRRNRTGRRRNDSLAKPHYNDKMTDVITNFGCIFFLKDITK